ncbi:MAG: hypothetical protein QME81_17130, partial [bacterium]|nr:hypothetical protein [bacterium]
MSPDPKPNVNIPVDKISGPIAHADSYLEDFKLFVMFLNFHIHFSWHFRFNHIFNFLKMCILARPLAATKPILDCRLR